MNPRRWVPAGLRRWLGLYLFDRLFPLWERLGFHVVPNNYMSPIPDLRTLKPDLWSKPSELPGIEMNDQAQLRLLHRLASQWGAEFDGVLAAPEQGPYTGDRSKFGLMDGAVAYAMVRSLKPRRVLEVGSGHSTFLLGQAVVKNRRDGVATELVACEPYPNAALRSGLAGLSRLVPLPAQDLGLAEFARLGENDILFIDSSHVLRTGGDVQHLFLEVLPRLQQGVHVHVHDIFFPLDYPADWLFRNHRFYTEQYLLQAFLAFNRVFAVTWAGRYMQERYPRELAAAFPAHAAEASLASSFWMQRGEAGPA
jgi:predicted O-methyltransferase YrrM